MRAHAPPTVRAVASPDPPAPRYLDAASSEPLHPVARDTWLAAQEAGWADPLRLHQQARTARLLLDNARAVVADAFSVREDEVTFTGSGTSATHAGLLGLLRGRSRVSDRLAHSAVEHSAVFAAARWWQAWAGGAIEVLPVDGQGRLDPAALTPELTGDLAVVAVQHANPEVGTVQPVEALAAAAAGVPLFVDACASAGRLPIPDGWAAGAASAHKWGGPAGVGVLLVRKGARWRAPFPTDDRSDPRTSGYEDVPGVLAAAAALQAAVVEREERNARHERLGTRLRAVLAGLPDVEVHGDPRAGSEQRLPHLVSFSCLYVDGETLVTELDRRGFAVASGSACTASALEPSHVLVAMGALTHGNVRVAFTRTTTEEDVDALAAVLPAVVGELRDRALP
jgi:cysteine desulfurase